MLLTLSSDYVLLQMKMIAEMNHVYTANASMKLMVTTVNVHFCSKERTVQKVSTVSNYQIYEKRD